MKAHISALIYVLLFLLANSLFAWSLPVDDFIVTSAYGPRTLYNSDHSFRKHEFHAGIDYRAKNALLKAVTKGDIMDIVFQPSGAAGNYIRISDGTYSIRYLHLSQIKANLYALIPANNVDADYDFPIPVVIFWNINGSVKRVLLEKKNTANFVAINIITQTLGITSTSISSVVNETDDLAYSGDSGPQGTELHGHIDIDYNYPNKTPSINPLYFLPYNPKNPEVDFLDGKLCDNSNRNPPAVDDPTEDISIPAELELQTDRYFRRWGQTHSKENEDRIRFRIKESDQIERTGTDGNQETVWGSNGVDLNSVHIYVNSDFEFNKQNILVNDSNTNDHQLFEWSFGGRLHSKNAGNEPANSTDEKINVGTPPRYNGPDGYSDDAAGNPEGYTTGIYPIRPTPGLLDFIFNWNSKISTDFVRNASVNSQAKFPDGYYWIFVRSENIRGPQIPAIDQKIRVIVNNFKPYLSKLELFQDIGGQPVSIYNGSYSLVNNSENLVKNVFGRNVTSSAVRFHVVVQ